MVEFLHNHIVWMLGDCVMRFVEDQEPNVLPQINITLQRTPYNQATRRGHSKQAYMSQRVEKDLRRGHNDAVGTQDTPPQG